ncbi:MAG: hypothetical protein K8F92_07840 [Hyphomicrobium sp.]|uniref:hypothetical protein n=1 Tax=Hyphomicrobium sp. TaxID=82 RepID=UPI0013294DC4|nr:hypothetical protein [Hyphomicrobium sp.]KAB2940035.1 MAG: hypothetical protein F9K20_14365 [Hyphomicrobium sp.]MBZ0209550.1 hypothetical protein [Hyphomicrobium sp.]
MSRIMNWIERDSARTDEILASRPTLWIIIRTLAGVLVSVKGVALTMHAAHAWHYALAPLLFVGGIMLAFESTKILLERVQTRTPSAIEHE